MQVWVIAKYEFINYIRSKRFYLLLAIGLAFSIAITVIVGYYGTSAFGGTPLGFYSRWWGDSASYVAVFCAIFFGGDAISGEFHSRTGYFLMPNPIRRSSVYVGKWLAAFIASLIIIGIFTAITVLNSVYQFGAVSTSIPGVFLDSLLFTFVYLASSLGITFLFSSSFKSSSISILVSTILLLVGFTLAGNLLTAFSHTEPWFLLSYGSQIISDVLTLPYPPHTSLSGFGPSGLGKAFMTFNPTILEGLLIMLVYFVLASAIGLLLFERKEFN